MTDRRRMGIEPAPTPEEAAAIAAALEALGGKKAESGFSARSRWRLAGMLGHPVPPRVKLDGALWSYSSWEGGL